MIKKAIYCVALASSLMLATSCSQDEPQHVGFSNNKIQVYPYFNAATRSTETTISNLGSFVVTAFQDGQTNYMDGVKYTSSDGGNNWSTTAGNFYWPSSGDLHLYAYAPEIPGKEGGFTINKDVQKLENFVPNTAVANQKDFVYAKATGSSQSNGSTGIGINFQHALSEISIKAKNSNTAYTVDVTGAKLVNITSKGTFTFPTPSGGAASWAPSSDTGAKTDYAIEWRSSGILRLSGSETGVGSGFMLIPQQLTKSTKASAGSCIALHIKVTMQGGDIIHDGWAYVGIDTNWEMGKKYNYTLDLSKGVGQDVDGNRIFSNSEIKVNCDVSDWNEDKIEETPHLEGIYDANCIIINTNKNNWYGIDITRANRFWSNPDVGDVNNVINKYDRLIAEVIWQDIPFNAVSFVNAQGIKTSKFFYMSNYIFISVPNKNFKGNAVLGIRKEDSTDYLWSWHLWFTDEPKEIAGFMDRNLGATSANPADGEKTYGLYYQFGRKDPFVGKVDIYDGDGNKIQTGSTIATGKVSFAKAVNTPGTFYTYGSSSPSDWASPNNYTSKRWNDITNSSGKTFFDPCPPGWKMPERTAFSGFSNSTFTWDGTNKGRTYQSNWFPAAGSRSYLNGDVISRGSYGFCWSESSYGISGGYYLRFDSSDVNPQSSSVRAFGFPVRCVRE